MKNDDRWFAEYHAPDVKLALEAELLYQEQTPYQKLAVLRNRSFGVFLALDGFVQSTERDEFIYHDMICHPALAVNPNIKRVLIIGGGDGGTAREVARYPQIQSIDMVEIDEAVCRACQRFLPQMADVFSSEPRLNLLIGDGVAFVAAAKDATYDLIIVDSTDPIGPGEGLFSHKFYADCNRILSDQGILINQHESAFYDNDATELRRAHQKIAANFPIARIYGFNMPTYASGYWYFGFASKQLDPLADLQAEYWRSLGLKSDYYNIEVHRAAFAMPNYVRRILDLDA